MEQKQLDILDILTIMSFVIGLQALELAQKNLIENREQTDNTQKILEELENHLHTQDEHLHKQDEILQNITK